MRRAISIKQSLKEVMRAWSAARISIFAFTAPAEAPTPTRIAATANRKNTCRAIVGHMPLLDAGLLAPTLCQDDFALINVIKG